MLPRHSYSPTSIEYSASGWACSMGGCRTGTGKSTARLHLCECASISCLSATETMPSRRPEKARRLILFSWSHAAASRLKRTLFIEEIRANVAVCYLPRFTRHGASGTELRTANPASGEARVTGTAQHNSGIITDGLEGSGSAWGLSVVVVAGSTLPVSVSSN